MKSGAGTLPCPVDGETRNLSGRQKQDIDAPTNPINQTTHISCCCIGFGAKAKLRASLHMLPDISSKRFSEIVPVDELLGRGLIHFGKNLSE